MSRPLAAYFAAVALSHALALWVVAHPVTYPNARILLATILATEIRASLLLALFSPLLWWVFTREKCTGVYINCEGRRVILTDREADGLATEDGPVDGAAAWMAARVRALRGAR